MANGVETQQIRPGPCPPGGCPPATRIECISVDKVFDSCFQVEDHTRSIKITDFFPTPDVGDVVPCSLTPGQQITCEAISKTAVGGGFFTLILRVTIPVTLTNPGDPDDKVDRIFTFLKTVTLCCPEGTDVDCSESTLISCNCVVTSVADDSGNNQVTPVTPIGEVTVECDFQICLVIKCIARVQLLVPSFGFCVPAPCVTLPGACPPAPPLQCF
ncbi:hypothetical protein [Moorella sulfitireducens (nom. illeg.)]|uniref:hypothetical protein n=1 Tax=Neomoorella sulfitireducens TaxID=2972948 RepID=UPI0021AC027E|nr:hypothetical protein [Moorella sulfitireducens]